MPPDRRLDLTLNSPEDTAQLAARLGQCLLPRDVVLLEGPIGAGKTHFARALIQSLLTQPEDVPSPTFTLVQTYDGPECEIWHSDLYRLGHPDEVVELGLLDAFDTAISLVEWPDRLGDLQPPAALKVSLTPCAQDEMRHVRLSWQDARWDDRIKELADA